MSKFDEMLDKYRAALTGQEYDDALLVQIAKDLGPSIYLADASLVACSDKEETDRVKKNFLIGKLGLTEADDLDGYIAEACRIMGFNFKYRAVFYLILVMQTDMAHRILN
jgi:hypothetical protein